MLLQNRLRIEFENLGNPQKQLAGRSITVQLKRPFRAWRMGLQIVSSHEHLSQSPRDGSSPLSLAGILIPAPALNVFVSPARRMPEDRTFREQRKVASFMPLKPIVQFFG